MYFNRTSRRYLGYAFLQKYPEFKRDAEPFGDLLQRPHSQQGVSSHFEKPVMTADRTYRLNQFRPYLGDDRLDGTDRSLVAPERARTFNRRRQSGTIYLAVRRKRYFVNCQKIVRNHVVGQPRAQMPT